jgi:hypothetical protein
MELKITRPGWICRADLQLNYGMSPKAFIYINEVKSAVIIKD